jgi:hypothetical protein
MSLARSVTANSRAISLGTSNFLGIQSDPNRARFSELALTCAQKPFDVDDLKFGPICWMVEREKDTLTYSRYVFDPIYGNCPNYRVFRDIEELQIVLLLNVAASRPSITLVALAKSPINTVGLANLKFFVR